MAERIAIGFLEAPKMVQFPSMTYFTEHQSIMDKLLKVSKALPRHQQKQLRDYIQTALHPGVPKEHIPAISSSPRELMSHVMQYCNPLNMKLIKMIIVHLNNDVLTRQLKEYERTLSDQIQHAVWDTEIDVAPPPAYIQIMFVKMKQRGRTTVGEAVAVREFLAEHLMFKGQQGILCLAGLANDTLVFYVSEGSVGPMLHRMQYEKDEVRAQGVEEVTFVKIAKLDVRSGGITPHPEVPKIDSAKECPEFGVLLIGETGSGKSTLINNLLGTDVVPEGHGCYSETGEITQYRGTASGVPVILYDTPGTDGTTAGSDSDLCKEIKRLFKYKKICLTIFCFSMNEQNLKRSHIATMRAYHKAKVNWDRTIVALTFADKIKAPRAERKSEGFNEAEYFQRKVKEWQGQLRDTLVQSVGVSRSVAENLIMRPTTDERESPLPDNEEWFIPLWLDILDLLEPAAYLRFVEIHRERIRYIMTLGPITGRQRRRFWQIAEYRSMLLPITLCISDTSSARTRERTSTDC